jgi:hypothetical protein
LQACNEVLPFIQQLSEIPGSDIAGTIEEFVTHVQTTPEWTNSTATEQRDTIAGIRAAADGEC